MKTKHWIVFIALGIIWSSSFLWIKIAVQEMDPITLVAYRVLFGLLFGLIVVFIQRPQWPLTFKEWFPILLLGITNVAIPFFLISWGEQAIDSAVAAILDSTVPLFTIVIAHFILHDDRMTFPKVFGLLLGFAGVVILMSKDIGASAGPLWRDSHEAFCPRSNANSAFADVWSDDRGVFVLASDANSHLAIWSNIGTGWQMTFNWPGEANDLYQGGLKGFPDGPLVVYGGFPCGIQFVDGRGAECSAAANFVVDLSVVNASLAYAVNYDRVLQFDGKFWTQLGDPLPGVSWANAVWADSSTVVVGADGNGGGGLVFKIESGGAPVLQAGLSPQINPIAAWSFGASDIWVGDDQGQIVHYDGAGWSEMATIPYSGSGSRPVSRSGGAGTKLKLWGNNGSLFAIAGNIFGQWDGTRFKILDSLDSDAYFAGLWGNSPSEVFLAVHDGQSTADKCGPLRVWWFNGSVVGPL